MVVVVEVAAAVIALPAATIAVLITLDVEARQDVPVDGVISLRRVETVGPRALPGGHTLPVGRADVMVAVAEKVVGVTVVVADAVVVSVVVTTASEAMMGGKHGLATLFFSRKLDD